MSKAKKILVKSPKKNTVKAESLKTKTGLRAGVTWYSGWAKAW